jgi:hypothetical protein
MATLTQNADFYDKKFHSTGFQEKRKLFGRTIGL